MFKSLSKLSVLSLVCISLIAGHTREAKAVDVTGKVTLNALSRKIVNSVDTFYQGRDNSVKPNKKIDIEGTYDEADVPLSLEIEEDTTEAAKYSFTFPAQVSSIVADLFAKDFGKKRRLRTNLKSVNSIVGSFVGEVESDSSGSTGSIGSIDSVGSVTNVNSSLNFVTAAVRAVRTAKKPDVVKIRGILKNVKDKILNSERI